MKTYNEVEILLVEDNLSDAELTVRALKRANLANKLVHLTDGAEAIDFIFSKGQYENRSSHKLPKLILLDIKMPKIDGIEVLRQIKSNESTRMVPVVIMTSSKEEQDVIASYKLGVNGYVVKPLKFEEFAKAIGTLGLYWLLLNELPPGLTD